MQANGIGHSQTKVLSQELIPQGLVTVVDTRFGTIFRQIVYQVADVVK